MKPGDLVIGRSWEAAQRTGVFFNNHRDSVDAKVQNRMQGKVFRVKEINGRYVRLVTLDGEPVPNSMNGVCPERLTLL